MAVIAWDCADDEYRERAYNGMAAENERLRAALDLARTELQTMGEFLSSEGYFVRARDVQETLHKIAVLTEQSARERDR
jgi:hypothetical protein